MMRSIVSVFLLMLASVFGYADTYVRQPGVDAVHYDISLELTDATDVIHGTTRIRVRILKTGVSGMRLDFAGLLVDRLQVQGKQRNYSLRDGHLSFEFGQRFARNEVAVVEVRYHGKPKQGLLIGKNKYGRRVFFSENWPDRAHFWFPSIDHPSDKATVQITVTAPRKYDVVSNGNLIQASLLPDGRKRTRWAERKPIPTYCIAIGVAEFIIAHQQPVNGVPITWYLYPEDAGATGQRLSRTASVLSYFSSLIGPYPYEKLAQVEATAHFEGMENSSVIFYIQSLFEGTAEIPLSHEIAHQWFGDSVTEKDWDELWLSEGFATYMEALFREHVDGPESMRQLMGDHARYLTLSQYARATPVIDPAQTDLMQKLNLLNYSKGAWILHMLRGMLGDAQFFRGLRLYYNRHTGATASSKDFEKAMETVSGIPLESFFGQWLTRPGWPEYVLSWRWDSKAREAEIEVRQKQTAGLFDMTVEIGIEMQSGRELRKFRVSESECVFRVPLPLKPLTIRLDPGNWILKSVEYSNAQNSAGFHD